MANITGWRTSTRTLGQGQCVEVGFGGRRVGVRDTKNRAEGAPSRALNPSRAFCTACSLSIPLRNSQFG